jgi:hypothetical protein
MCGASSKARQAHTLSVATNCAPYGVYSSKQEPKSPFVFTSERGALRACRVDEGLRQSYSREGNGWLAAHAQSLCYVRAEAECKHQGSYCQSKHRDQAQKT